MKAPSLTDFFDQRKLHSHAMMFLLSLIITLVSYISGKLTGESGFSLFLMLLLQLEAFIFLGHILFARLKFDGSPARITRLVLVRFIGFLGGCLCFSMILFILMQISQAWIHGETASNVIFNFIHSGFRTWFSSTIKGLSFGSVIFVVLLWQTSLRREQKFREEKLIFQNETLKSQINPHFLFNSLNTISSLIQTQPEAAEQFINNLASVYRYILENGQKDFVPLQSEIGFLSDYSNLHKVRDEDKIIINIDVPEAEKYKVLPVSLQILLENAIKHNIATRENKLRVSIYAEDQFIVVKNNLQKKATQLASTGTGLKNLAERVLLTIKRELIVEETDEYFTVKLPLLK